MKIRFVQGKGLISQAIVAQSKTAMPFTPSHVEAVVPNFVAGVVVLPNEPADATVYIGAHLVGGIQARPAGYDADDINHELILDLADATPDQDRMFWKFMVSKIGEDYDLHAIAGFLIPEHFHTPNTAICSAVTALGLRACGWLQYRLACPAHLMSPRDDLLLISGRMQIPGV